MTDPPEETKEKLQQFYLAVRSLLAGGAVPPWAAQRSFEEAIHGYTQHESWRPTHISREAMREALSGFASKIQRAHGMVDGRMERYDRTLTVLTGPEQEFDVWWSFWKKHDATVLITREEHGSGRKFDLEELVPLPDPARGLFVAGGFSFKMRKKSELKWIREKWEEMQTEGENDSA